MHAFPPCNQLEQHHQMPPQTLPPAGGVHKHVPPGTHQRDMKCVRRRQGEAVSSHHRGHSTRAFGLYSAVVSTPAESLSTFQKSYEISVHFQLNLIQEHHHVTHMYEMVMCDSQCQHGLANHLIHPLALHTEPAHPFPDAKHRREHLVSH
jgi:hypothetical protein